MNPFESARHGALLLRRDLETKGAGLLPQNGLALVKAACKDLNVALRVVKANFHLLKGADATINIKSKWICVRNDVPDEIKAFLVAHELGHLLLHPATSSTLSVSQDDLTIDAETNGAREVESYGARERQELQANVFAREFLLPRDMARRAFIDIQQSASELAEDFGLPLELVRLQLYDAILLPNITKPSKVHQLPDKPTDAQEPAVNSDAKVSLVEAGPGTGKTTTLLLRLRRLIASGVAPENIVILTFSNKAARELIERARAGNIPGTDRVWIGTFHAFGLEFLRKFGNLYGLEPRFPILDKLASLAMLETGTTNLDLESFDPLSNPSPWLEDALDAIRRAKDEVFDAAQFRVVVEQTPSDNPEIDAKLRDVATIFELYERLLSQHKAVDLTDLLCASIRILQSGDSAVNRFLDGIKHLMVDEYQDVNRASALLVKELAKACQTLWVVGDANQAIYAFMGASSSNLEKFQTDFPGAVCIPLALNHRSSQEIVDVFDTVASRNPAGRQTFPMTTTRGQLGHGPSRIHTTSEREQQIALSWRIRTLVESGIPLAEQAVIVFKNADAAKIATGLEQHSVPVLYLGNIFERPEIKDLICLMQLATDPYGVNLVRQWHSPHLALSRQGADIVLTQIRTKKKDWRQVICEELSSQDKHALQNLQRLCSVIAENNSPWDALSHLLLEDGAWLREMAARQGQSAANALMAVWQFVHFCRSPDGTGRQITIKNLPQRIRDRIRLGEDRSMRAVPPEAEGMNAIRILTAHGSKGLEFDAIHFLGVTQGTYETPWLNHNSLVPATVFENRSREDILNNERHNLLYVAVSRPRTHLTIYSTTDENLPTALNGLLEQIRSGWQKYDSTPTKAQLPVEPKKTTVSMEEYLQFVRCPRHHEMSLRAGRSLRDELKTHRAVDVATRKCVQALATDNELMPNEELHNVIETELSNLGLHEHAAAHHIHERVTKRVRNARALLTEGGVNTSKITLAIGLLNVELQPDQILQDGATRRLRLIRPNKSNLPRMKQPLAALLDAHHNAGGERTKIEVATLSDGLITSVGTIQARTRPKYEDVALKFCTQHFPAAPSKARECLLCPYSFPCNKQDTDD